jgi:hypothetical protein
MEEEIFFRFPFTDIELHCFLKALDIQFCFLWYYLSQALLHDKPLALIDLAHLCFQRS